MHHLVGTVATPELTAATAALQRLPKDALGEVRLDALWRGVPEDGLAADQITALLDAAPGQLVATLRASRQGGQFHGDEKVRLGLLEAAARSGFRWIDVENDLQAMAPLLHHLSRVCKHIVLSNHLQAMPDAQLGLRHLTAMQDLGGSLHKLAFPAPSLPGHLRALELAWQHAGRHGRPAIQPITDPEDAPRVRALLALVGNHATYGHAPGLPSLPGQPALDAIQATWDHWGLPEEELAPNNGRPWYAVVGDPIDGSLSPRMHNAALRAMRMEARFGALRVPDQPGMLRLTLAAAARIGLEGVSVTAPLKEEALRLAQSDDDATHIGAVNCIRMEQGVPRGTNTDATAIERLVGPSKGKDALVLGSGGAARAAVHALQKTGAHVTFTGRDPARAEKLRHDLEAGWVPWDDRHGQTPDILVQATPGEDVWSGPLDGVTVVELRYQETPTRLEAAARRTGARSITGRDVLLEQGVDAFRFWTGSEPDRDAMEAALR